MKNVQFTGASVEKRPYGMEVAVRTGVLCGGAVAAWAPTVGLSVAVAAVVGFVVGVGGDVGLYYLKEAVLARRATKALE